VNTGVGQSKCNIKIILTHKFLFKQREWTDKSSSPRTETLGLLPCVAAELYRTPIIAFLQCGQPIARNTYYTSSSKYNLVTIARAEQSNRRALGRGVRLR
jgi:hypothetical protein